MTEFIERMSGAPVPVPAAAAPHMGPATVDWFAGYLDRKADEFMTMLGEKAQCSGGPDFCDIEGALRDVVKLFTSQVMGEMSVHVAHTVHEEMEARRRHAAGS